MKPRTTRCDSSAKRRTPSASITFLIGLIIAMIIGGSLIIQPQIRTGGYWRRVAGIYLVPTIPTNSVGAPSARISKFWGDDADFTVLSISGVATGSVTISATSPVLNYKDTDAAAGDVNASIQVDATDTGDGTEDIDVTFKQQVDGIITTWLVADADGVVTIGTATQNTTVTGDLTITGDDLYMATNTTGAILVGDNTNFNPVVMASDATIAANGDLTIANDAVALTTDTTGNYVLSITDGDNGIDGGDGGSEGAALTLSFDSTEINATTWSDNANASNAWTFDVSGTDHTMTAGNGIMTFSHAVTVSGATTSTGVLSIDDTTETTSGTTGSVHTDGGLGVAKDIYVGDDVLLADGAVVGITGNEILTWDAAGTITIDGANFHISDGNGLVIGHTAQLTTGGTTAELQMLGTEAADSTISVGTWSNDAASGLFKFYKSRNTTIGSFTAVTAGDNLGIVQAFGDDGIDDDTLSSQIRFDTEGTIDTGRVPGIIIFSTAKDTGDFSLVEALKIDSTQALTITGDATLAGNAVDLTADGLTTGTALNITSTSTDGGASGISYMAKLARSGTNSNTAHTAYGIHATVTNTNVTSGTNIAGYFSASGATTANYGLIVENGNVGIGTATPGITGNAKLEILGADSNVAGPHTVWKTDADIYPLQQIVAWTHDNTAINFDAYYDGGHKSSDAGSNARIHKNDDLLKFRYDSGVAQGAELTWNDGMVIDLTNGNIGMGTISPDTLLELSKDSANAELTISTYHDTEATTPTLTFRKADNTEASPAVVDSGAVLGTINFNGYDDNGFDTGAVIYAKADANWGAAERGTDLIFQTRDGNGALTDRLTIMADGTTDVVGAVTAGTIASDAGVSGTTATFTAELDMTGVNATIDLNPSGTATVNIINITPSSAIGNLAVWRGLYINGTALDPSDVDAEICGLDIDLSGVSETNIPLIIGLRVNVPEDVDAIHISEGQLHMDTLLPNTAATEFTGIDIVIDSSLMAATSDYHAMDVATTGTPAGNLVAVGTHAGVAPINQHIGTFTTPDQGEYAGVKHTGGTVWADGIDVYGVIFVDDDDEIYVGNTAGAGQFSEIEVIMTTGGTKSITPTFWYNTAADSWTPFFPADDTDGFQQSGEIRWELASISGTWTNDGDPGGGSASTGYWIKIIRTRNGSVGSPDPTTVKTGIVTEYEWNKDGQLSVADVFLDDGGTVGISGNELLTFNAGGTINVSGADLLIDNGNGMVIGHTAQLQIQGTTPEFQLLGTGNGDSTLAILRASDNVSSADIILTKARGTLASPTIITTGNSLGAIYAIGHDGVDLATISSQIIFDTEGTIAENRIPGVMIFTTGTDAAPTVLTEALRLDSSQNATFAGNIIANSNYVLEGYATGRNVTRSIRLTITPGGTPGTDISIDDISSTVYTFNAPSITDVTDLTKTETDGQWTLNAGGTTITLNLTEDVVGILSTGFAIQDLNSSTAPTYFPSAIITGSNLVISFSLEGTSAAVDLTTILDAGDTCDLLISFVTSS